jgi:hypothetical protein
MEKGPDNENFSAAPNLLNYKLTFLKLNAARESN